MQSSDRRQLQQGQVLVLFALSMAAIIAMAALLFTGAHALAERRQLQNTVDAAALDAANLLIAVNGCSAAGDGGGPRPAVVAAARESVATNRPSYDLSAVEVSCPKGYGNHAVAVGLKDTSPSFFGADGLSIGVSAAAVNGRTPLDDFNVATLNPSNPNWRAQRNGCPSFTVNGGILVTFEGSVIVNSTCTLDVSQNGAVKALNNAFRMYLLGEARMRIGGEYAANTAGKISPEPLQNARPLMPDPLAGLIPPCSSADSSGCLGDSTTLPSRSMSSTGTGQCTAPNDNPCILLPGTYAGGIHAGTGSGPSTILLRPGVYYIRGGGLSLKSASGRIFSIPSAAVMPDELARQRYATTLSDTQVATNWQEDCPGPPATTTCGVLIYNAPSASGNWQVSGGNADTMTNGSQGVFELRAYNPDSDSLGHGKLFERYKNVVLWQARTPAPAPNKSQPVVSMVGGACTVLSGTVYAPGALLEFGGTTCGTGGGNDEKMTIQFIVWDLTLAGNNDFYFAYRSGNFIIPLGYGLIQ
jgi:hypothetical protein